MNILLISGSKEHKILVFVQRIPVKCPTESRPFGFLFYDLNVGSNILSVGGKFLKAKSMNQPGFTVMHYIAYTTTEKSVVLADV